MKSSNAPIRYSYVSAKYGEMIFEKIFERYEDVFSTYFKNKKSRNTRIAYLNDVRLFFTYMFYSKRDINPKKVTYKDMVNYREFLVENKFDFNGKMIAYSKSTINRKLSSVSSFFIELIRHGELESNPCTHVERFNISEIPKTEAIAEEKVSLLFSKMPREKLVHKLHYAILITFFYTGLRVSEITNIKIKDLKLRDGFGLLTFTNKGGGEKLKTINQKACAAITEYLDACKESGYDMDESCFLFRPTNKGSSLGVNKRMQSSSVRRMLRDKFKKYTDPNDHHYPHQARATYITELFKLNFNASDIADDVFHKSIKTTNGYRSSASFRKGLSREIHF